MPAVIEDRAPPGVFTSNAGADVVAEKALRSCRGPASRLAASHTLRRSDIAIFVRLFSRSDYQGFR